MGFSVVLQSTSLEWLFIYSPFFPVGLEKAVAAWCCSPLVQGTKCFFGDGEGRRKRKIKAVSTPAAEPAVS